MNIKSYKLFLESRQFFPQSDIKKVKELFTTSVADYFDDLTYHERKNPFDTSKMDQWEAVLHRRELDEDGKGPLTSKWAKEIKYLSMNDPKYSASTKIKLHQKYFNDYQELIINVKYHDESIIEYLNHFYQLLIDEGFLVNAWTTSGDKRISDWRFHISTEESNPFIKCKNDLNKIID